MNNLRTSNVDAALCPGGGVEAFLGIIGLRLEVGDEIFFREWSHQQQESFIQPPNPFLGMYGSLVESNRRRELWRTCVPGRMIHISRFHFLQ